MSCSKSDDNKIELVFNLQVKDAIDILYRRLTPKVVMIPGGTMSLWTKSDNRKMNEADPLWYYDLKEGVR